MTTAKAALVSEMTEPTTKAGRRRLMEWAAAQGPDFTEEGWATEAKQIAAIEAEAREQGRREAAIRIFESNVGVPHHWLDLASPEAERRLGIALSIVEHRAMAGPDEPGPQTWIDARAILEVLRRS